MGFLRPDPLRWRARLLPRPSPARQDPSPSAASPGQSTGRDTARLFGSPADLSRSNRLAELAYGRRLTFTAVGCLAEIAAVLTFRPPGVNTAARTLWIGKRRSWVGVS